MCRNGTSAKVLFGCFNTMFFVSNKLNVFICVFVSYIVLSYLFSLLLLKACGCLEVICGFLLLCDSKRILLSQLLAAPDSELAHPPFYYLALALLVSGLAMCATGALGCWTTYMPGYAVLSIVSIFGIAMLKYILNIYQR